MNIKLIYLHSLANTISRRAIKVHHYPFFTVFNWNSCPFLYSTPAITLFLFYRMTHPNEEQIARSKKSRRQIKHNPCLHHLPFGLLQWSAVQGIQQSTEQASAFVELFKSQSSYPDQAVAEDHPHPHPPLLAPDQVLHYDES